MNRYTNKLVRFINGLNAVVIENDSDFDTFIELMKLFGLDFNNYNSYAELVKVAKINNWLIEDRAIIVEYQVDKGFSIGYETYEDCEDWYEEKVYTISDLATSY